LPTARCPTAGRDADYNVLGSEARCEQITSSGGRVVFYAFHGFDQGPVASRNNAANQIGIDAERRRAFRRIEHAQSPAGSGSDVSQLAALVENVRDRFDGRRDLRDGSVNCSRDFRVGRLDHSKQIGGRQQIQIAGALMGLLGRQSLKHFVALL
jgi:hypothetical protein